MPQMCGNPYTWPFNVVFFLVASSTQNLGSLDEVHYDGLEFELNSRITDNFSLNLGVATMNDEVEQDAQIPYVVGKHVPLVSDYTVNLGANWVKPLSSGRKVSSQVR